MPGPIFCIKLNHGQLIHFRLYFVKHYQHSPNTFNIFTGMRSFLICLLLLGICTSVMAQEHTYYYGSDFGIVTNPEISVYKRVVKTISSKQTRISTYTKTEGTWQSTKIQRIKQKSANTYRIRSSGDRLLSKSYIRTYERLDNEKYAFSDFKSDELIQKGTATEVIPLHLVDTLISYYPSGRIKSRAVYFENRLIENRNWLQTGTPYYDNIHYFVDNIPEYSMGPAYFRNYIIAGLKDSGLDLSLISDRVIIAWVVLENGEISGIHTKSGVYKELNSLLMTLIQEMPGKWIPASLHGRPVRYYMEIPFNFIDRTENFESLELSSGFLIWD